MKQDLSRRAFSSIVVTCIAGLGFVACTIDERGTNNSSSGSTTGSVTTSSGMGGEPAGSTSSSSGTAGMGGAGGGMQEMQGKPCPASGCGSVLVCEDDVCCEKVCGECESCNQAGSMGTCKAVSEGTDDCTNNGELCNDKGQCECGVSVPVTADVPCGAGWDNPMPGVCFRNCDVLGKCDGGGMIDCPSGADCVIDCSIAKACEGKTFNCPPGHKCTMNCDNMDSCKDAVLNCSDDGPCNVECTGSGANYCKVTVNCGFNSCSSNCGGGGKPMIQPKPGTVCPAPLCPP
jgi:hypothetical protein